jgi:hypothetical protein
VKRIVAAKKFHATLRPKIDAEISKITELLDAEQSEEGKEPDRLRYQYSEEPDVFIQDGVAKRPKKVLGGWMRAKAPWIKD